jgi:hypothetical protein
MEYTFILTLFFVFVSISFASEDVLSYCNKDNIDCKNYIQSGIIDESLNELDEEDSRLIEQIRQRILPIPSAGKINLYKRHKRNKQIIRVSFSQILQIGLERQMSLCQKAVLIELSIRRGLNSR